MTSPSSCSLLNGAMRCPVEQLHSVQPQTLFRKWNVSNGCIMLRLCLSLKTLHPTGEPGATALESLGELLSPSRAPIASLNDGKGYCTRLWGPRIHYPPCTPPRCRTSSVFGENDEVCNYCWGSLSKRKVKLGFAVRPRNSVEGKTRPRLASD